MIFAHLPKINSPINTPTCIDFAVKLARIPFQNRSTKCLQKWSLFGLPLDQFLVDLGFQLGVQKYTGFSENGATGCESTHCSVASLWFLFYFGVRMTPGLLQDSRDPFQGRFFNNFGAQLGGFWTPTWHLPTICLQCCTGWWGHTKRKEFPRTSKNCISNSRSTAPADVLSIFQNALLRDRVNDFQNVVTPE